MRLDRASFQPRRSVPFLALAFALLAVACGSASSVESSLTDAVTAEPSPTTPPEPAAPTVTPPTPTPTAAPVFTSDAPAVESLYAEPAEPGGWPITAGEWISHSFSVPLLFDLPVEGTVINDGAGRLEIAVGDPAAPTGFLLLVEPLAVNSPSGPIPIALVEPDTAFGSAEVLSNEVIGDADRPLDVYDARFPPNPSLSQFRSTCDRNPSYQCLVPYVTLSNFVYLEQDLTHRFVSREWADGSLIVIATAIDDLDKTFLDHAQTVAGSARPVPASAHDGIRWMAALGDRSTEIPAGQYVARVGETALEFDLGAAVEDVRVGAIRPSVLGFAAENESGQRLGWLRFFDFDNFINPETGETRVDTAAMQPLSAEEFEAGLAELLVIEQTGTQAVGGLPASFFDATAEQGVGENCALASGWTNPRATCVRWARMLNPYWIVQASDVVDRHLYLPQADLLVVISPESGLTVDDVLADVQPILDGLLIRSTQ